MSEPLVYFVLGSADSGRHEILADLVQFGLDPADQPCVLVPEHELEASRKIFAGLKVGFPVGGWMLEGERLAVAAPPGVSHLFLLGDGRADPMDQVEALSNWLPFTPFDLGRIITVVNCSLLSRTPPLMRWYDACIHFSDVVLLSRRENLDNKWVSEYVEHLEKDSLPCLIELVKKGKVKNPVLVLYPEARRLSLMFDEEEHLYTDDDDATDEEAVTPMVEPWLERLLSGRRVKELPDINKFLDS